MSAADTMSAEFLVHVLVRHERDVGNHVMLVTADQIYAHQQFARPDVGPGSRLESYRAVGLEWKRVRVLIIDEECAAFELVDLADSPYGGVEYREVSLDELSHRHHFTHADGPALVCACGKSFLPLGDPEHYSVPGIERLQDGDLTGWERHQRQHLTIIPREDTTPDA